MKLAVLTRRLAVGLAEAAERADRALVQTARQMEVAALSAARDVSRQALFLLPSAGLQAARFFERLGDEADARFADDPSVILESIGPAARRTARLMEALGNHGTDGARRVVRLLLGGEPATSSRIRAYQRQMGRQIVDLAHGGFDVLPIARSLRASAQRIREIEDDSEQ